MRERSGEYLMALVSRFATTWQRRTLSPSTKTFSAGRTQAHRLAAGIQQRLHGFERGTPPRVEAQRLALQHHAAARDARHVEQIVDEVREVAGLPFDHLARAAHRRRIGDALGEHVGDVADRRQRIAQFVRQHGEELVLAPIGFAQRLRVTRGDRAAPRVRSRERFCSSCMSRLESTAISRKNTTCATHWIGGASCGQFVNQIVASIGVSTLANNAGPRPPR